MRDVLANFFKRYGEPVDRRFLDVTVEQLIVHRSGMLGNEDRDPLTEYRWERVRNGTGYLADARPVVAKYMQARLVHDPGAKYSYSAGAYVVLAVIVSEVTGRTFEDYCREAVFAKLGLPGPRLNPDFRVLSGSGGWFVTAADYLEFLEIFDSANPFLSDAVKAWIDEMRTKWDGTNRAVWYSLGVNTSSRSGRWTVGHSGVQNWHGKDAQGRPISAVTSSYATRVSGKLSFFIAVTPDNAATRAAIGELRGLLVRPQLPAAETKSSR